MVAKVKLLCVMAALLSFAPVSAVKTDSEQQDNLIDLMRRERSQTQKVQLGLGADGSTSDAFHGEADDMAIQATGFAFNLNSLLQATIAAPTAAVPTTTQAAAVSSATVCAAMQNQARDFIRCDDNAGEGSCKGYLQVHNGAHYNCNGFCESLGYTCYESYKEGSETAACPVRAGNTMDCSGPNNDDYVCGCQATTAAPTAAVPTTTQVGGCDESSWPDVDSGIVCGECKVLVDRFSSFYGSCNGYCDAIGKTCVGAWEEQNDNCQVLYDMTCDQQIGSSDAICECSPDGEAATPPFLNQRYIIGSKGDTACPAGYEYIKTSAMCDEARFKLNITERKKKDDAWRKVRLPWCWLSRWGKANFNSHGDVGYGDHSKSRLLCKAWEACTSFATTAACPQERCTWMNNACNEAAYPVDCDVSKYSLSTPYETEPISGTENFAAMVRKCRSQWMNSGNFGGFVQRSDDGSGVCARFKREPSQSEWTDSEASDCESHPGLSGKCGAVCGTPYFESSTEGTTELSIQKTDAHFLCIHSKQCAKELVECASCTKKNHWKQCCTRDYILGKFSDNCKLWFKCMDEGIQGLEPFLRGFAGNPSNLVQLSSGLMPPADANDCKHPYLDAECDCYGEWQLECENTLGGSPGKEAVNDCIKEKLCTLPEVCTSWKCHTFEDNSIRCPLWTPCSTLLAVHKAGKAPKAEDTEVVEAPKYGTDESGTAMQDPLASRNHSRTSAGLTTPVASGKSMIESWAEEAGVKIIANKMHDRRLPRGNMSSGESAALLDKSVSGKSCARSSR